MRKVPTLFGFWQTSFSREKREVYQQALPSGSEIKGSHEKPSESAKSPEPVDVPLSTAARVGAADEGAKKTLATAPSEVLQYARGLLKNPPIQQGQPSRIVSREEGERIIGTGEATLDTRSISRFVSWDLNKIPQEIQEKFGILASVVLERKWVESNVDELNKVFNILNAGKKIAGLSPQQQELVNTFVSKQEVVTKAPQKESDRVMGEIQKAGEVFRNKDASTGEKFAAVFKVVGLGIKYLQTLFTELEQGLQVAGSQERGGTGSANQRLSDILRSTPGNGMEKFRSAKGAVEKKIKENTGRIQQIDEQVSGLESDRVKPEDGKTKEQQIHSLRAEKARLESENRVLRQVVVLIDQVMPRLQEGADRVTTLFKNLPEQFRRKFGEFTIDPGGLRLELGGTGILYDILHPQKGEQVFSLDQVLTALKSPQGQQLLMGALKETGYAEEKVRGILKEAGLLRESGAERGNVPKT